LDIVLVGAEGTNNFWRSCVVYCLTIGLIFLLPFFILFEYILLLYHLYLGAVENGGIVNKIGTYVLGIVARELDKPLYVVAESYKFERLFLLNQRDLPDRAMGGGAKLRFADIRPHTPVVAKKAAAAVLLLS